MDISFKTCFVRPTFIHNIRFYNSNNKKECLSMAEFDRDRIVAYRECGLSFCDICRHVGQNRTTFMRIMVNGLLRFILNSRQNRKVFPWITFEKTVVLCDRPCKTTTTSRTSSQNIGIFSVRPVFTPTMRRSLFTAAQTVSTATISADSLDNTV